jgi:hypothetical protein
MGDYASAKDIAEYKQQGLRPMATNPQKIKHECVVSPNIIAANGNCVSRVNEKYPHVVHCKACQWQALAVNEEHAAYYVRMHEGRHQYD